MHLRCNTGGNTMKHMALLAMAMYRVLAISSATDHSLTGSVLSSRHI
jgi:hypothetical protein